MSPGGAIFGESGSVNVTNSTFVGNIAPVGGTAIRTEVPARLSFVTISNGTPAPSLHGPVTVRNSVLVGLSCSGGQTFSGVVLATDSACTGASIIPTLGSTLGPLQNNGGPTETMALLFGSPAINAVPAGQCTDLGGSPVTTDQRGVARPQLGFCDAGAYELNGAGEVAVSKSASSTQVTPGGSFNWTITVTVTGGSTVLAVNLTDTLPAAFSYGTPTAAAPLNCSLAGLSLSCTLPAGTPPGTYTVTVPVTVPSNAVCGADVTNVVAYQYAGLTGQASSSVTIACGTVVIVKYENVPPPTPQSWTFTGTIPGLPQVLQTTGSTGSTGSALVTITNVPVGNFTIAEAEGRGQCQAGATSSDWETHGLVQVGGSLPTAGDVNSAPVTGSGSLAVPVQPNTTTYVAFGNVGCGSVLSGANLVVRKYADQFANFTGTTPLGGWTITITGTAGAATGFTATQQTNGAGQAFFLSIPDGTYTVCETLQSGWANVGSKYNTVTQAGLCRTGVTVNLNQTATVDFYNQPRVTIRVHKTLNIVGFTSNGQGWQFTLTGCGITPQTKTTDANGIAEFTDLPPAIGCSYTVTETVQPGWTPQFVSQTAQPVAGGQVVTLEFLNIRTFDPPCTDPNDPRCVPPPPPSTPTPTPTTPTTTTSTPTPTATPTNTPTPTPTNTPVTQIAGERTPGPVAALATPQAPATGDGFGSAQGGMSLLLVLAGLISLSLRLGFIALGRRTSR